MIGKLIGGYRIAAKIGQGGMGIVYAARHERLPKSIAVKVLSTAVAQDSAQVARFFTEAKAISVLQHSGIVTLYDYGQLEDGTIYILMELLAGQSLKERLDEAPLSMAESLHVIRQLGEALAVVHRHGIVHRDLKPANIMLIQSPDSGIAVKILDFGVAKFVQSLEVRSAPGTVLGTPAYMAPEQYEGNGQISDRSDVYALGIVAYEMLTGQYPYALPDSGWAALMRAHLEQPIRPPRSLVPELPAELADLLREMLDKEPTQRPSMEALSVRLGAMSEAVPRVIPAIHRAVNGGATETAPEAAAPSYRGRAELRASKLRLLFLLPLFAALIFIGFGVRKWAGSSVTHVATAPDAPTGMRFLAGGRIRIGSLRPEVNQAHKECQAELPGCKLELFERELNGPVVTIAPFLMDVHEVSNEQFVVFLNYPLGQKLEVVSERYVRMDGLPILDLHPDGSDILYDPKVPPSSQFSVKEGRGRYPVVQITWHGADKFCKSRGYALPTEFQWEFAARGTERRSYPWGAAPPSCTGVVIGRWKIPGTGQGACWSSEELRFAPVGTVAQDRSPEGLFDLGGNVEEWVADVWASPYQADSPRSSAQPYRAVRGGGWNDTLSSARGAGRSRWEADKPSSNIGFRCASGVGHVTTG